MEVQHTEIVQVIQNDSSDYTKKEHIDANVTTHLGAVLLITHKPTHVRVFLRRRRSDPSTALTGHVTVVNEAGAEVAKVDAICSLDWPPKERRSLADQRLDWDASLNFRLPDNATKSPGDYTLKTDVLDAAGNVCASNTVEFHLLPAPVMRVRVLAFRHMDPQEREYLQPAAQEVEQIREFINATFPCANWRSPDELSRLPAWDPLNPDEYADPLAFSWVNVPTTDAFEALNPVARPNARAQERSERALQQLLLETLAIRNEDLMVEQEDPSASSSPKDTNIDVRTLYLALVLDPTGRLGGAAMDSPDFATSNIVAAASVDWNGELSAHEIGHQLGRKHPGVPNARVHGRHVGQRRIDGDASRTGYLDDGGNERRTSIVGLDTRKTASGGTPSIVRPTRCYDLMTYRYPKWVSEYTYRAMYQRLVKLGCVPENPQVAAYHNWYERLRNNQSNHWTIIGKYNLRQRTASIEYLLKTNYVFDADDHVISDRLFVCYKRKDGTCAKERIYERSAAGSENAPHWGLFEHTLKDPDPTSPVELRIDGDVVASLKPSGQIPPSAWDSPQRLPVQQFVNEVRKHLNKKANPVKPGTAQRLRDPDDLFSTAGQRKEKMPRLELRYAPVQDEYRLEFRWPRGRLPLWDATRSAPWPHELTTTIKCKRPGSMVWETLYVSTRLRGSVWIPEEFFGRPAEPLDRVARARARKRRMDYAQMHAERDSDVAALSLRVYVSGGFERVLLWDQDADRLQVQSSNKRIPLRRLSLLGGRGHH
ncbi:MAG: hypothetical protein AAF417_21830 [Pseudomonadota bacterium]